MRAVEKRIPLVVAGVVILAAFAVGLFVALGGRSVVAGPDSAPGASPPNPGHSWSEIGDLPGTMWHSNNDGAGSGLDADTVDGQDAGQLLPSGVIVMWSGTLATIPSGWALCDGAIGTPDLRDRFIYGVSTGEDPGATGGSSTYSLTVSQLPVHTHTGTTNNAGGHSHRMILGAATGSTLRPWAHYNLYSNVYDYWTEWTGSHTHSLTINPTGGGSSIDNRPDYYKLAFIMKL